MAPHSSTLAWKIPWMEEPARLQSMGLRRVRPTEQAHMHTGHQRGLGSDPGSALYQLSDAGQVT